MGVRSHPVVGGLLMTVGIALLPAGLLVPARLFAPLPLAPSVAAPFVFWQLGVWSMLLGAYFLRPRPATRRRAPTAAPR